MSTIPRGWGVGRVTPQARVVRQLVAQPALLESTPSVLARDVASAYGLPRSTARRVVQRAREAARCADSTLRTTA